jgi:hypothetical protein
VARPAIGFLLVPQVFPVLFPQHSPVVVLHQIRQDAPRFVIVLHRQEEVFGEGFS